MVSKIMLLVALVAAFAAVDAGMLPGKHHDEKFYIYYMYQKTGQQCYGQEFMRQNELELRSMFTTCFMKVHYPPPAEEATKERRSVDADQTPKSDSNDLQDSNLTSEAQPEEEPPFFNAAFVVRPLKDEVLKHARTVGCLFDLLNLTITANGTVDASSLIAWYQDNPLVPEIVKGFLIDGIKTCEANSNQGDFMIWGQKYADFHKLLKFFRCADAEKFFACVKADFQKDAGDYDLSGLDGELSDVSDIAKRYFISSSYSNWDRTGLWDM